MEQVDEQEGLDASAVRVEDTPWHEAAPPGRGALSDGTGMPGAVGPGRPDTVPGQRVHSAAEIYLEVQRSPAFQEVRGRYRRFVFPATAAFLLWYLAYVVAATVAPGLMARPLVGVVNVAMAAGLGQFLTTFLLTWAYARHARLRRDWAALQLRWDTQEMTRGATRS
ncbi:MULTISPECIES: DUF485 domain-containing protein [unclassified Streptomyces]|uniref:DUF485 domain-containing protein n=1 Tax=unclassified Streptomyces TaxID=2593676 RepID=UPI0038019302